jgi:class 3 adenylate cyclase
VSDGEARKLVSVVFCDLAESTAFADAHDPEVVTGVLSRHFEVVRGALERHGGTVEKFIGDAVVGVFGSRGCARMTLFGLCVRQRRSRTASRR